MKNEKFWIHPLVYNIKEQLTSGTRADPFDYNRKVFNEIIEQHRMKTVSF